MTFYNSYFISLGNVVLRSNNDSKNYLDFNFVYKKNSYALHISKTNDIKSNMYSGNYNCFNMQKTSFSFDLNLNRFNHNIEVGEIFLDYFNDYQDRETGSDYLSWYKLQKMKMLMVSL